MIPTIVRDSASLERSVGSVSGSAEVIVVVDAAGSPSVPPVIADRVRVVHTGGGAGFATAAQLGVDAAQNEFVALLNDDAWFDPGALAGLEAALADQPGVAGLAPKVRLAAWPDLLNSVGTVLFGDGRSDSRGIGQPDLGQYDDPAPVFGLHFAAALLRAELFRPGAVGPLDTSFGTYYEDVDWCLRANVLGHRFVTHPTAVAWHEHSATASTLGQGFSFAHQQRNLVWTALKCFDRGRATRVAARRVAGLTKRRLSMGGPWVVPSILTGLPRVARQRKALQARRRTTDVRIMDLSRGERTWFDPDSGPVRSSACLIDALSRLDPELGSSLSARLRSGFDTREILERAPAAARAYWDALSEPMAPRT